VHAYLVLEVVGGFPKLGYFLVYIVFDDWIGVLLVSIFRCRVFIEALQ